MGDLVLSMPEVIVFGNRPMVSSLQVAQHFGKRHDNVIRDIKRLEIPEKFYLLNFAEITYEDSRGRKQPAYLMTRDGFALLAMGFTGKKAMEWKIRYIEAFNAMERKLKEDFQRKLLLEQEEFKKGLLEIVEKRVDEKIDEEIEERLEQKLEQILQVKLPQTLTKRIPLPVKVVEYKGLKFRFFVTDSQLCLYAKDLAILLGANEANINSYVKFLKEKGFVPKEDFRSEYVSFITEEYDITPKEFLQKMELPPTSFHFFCYITFAGFNKIKYMEPGLYDIIVKEVLPYFPDMYVNYNSRKKNKIYFENCE